MEMDCKDGNLYSITILENLAKAPDVTLVPYNSGLDSNQTFQQYFFKQNKMLWKYTALIVHNCFGIQKN